MKVITFFTFLAGIAATYAVALPSAESKRELHSTTSISLPETHSHSKRLESFTVYVCNDPFFEGPCLHLKGAPEECQDLEAFDDGKWFRSISSIQPDEFADCSFFATHNCDPVKGFITMLNPGNDNLLPTGLDNRIESYRCSNSLLAPGYQS